MKTESEIRDALNHLEDIMKGEQEDDTETLNDADKAIDVLRWVLGEPDEDGLPSRFGVFLVAMA